LVISGDCNVSLLAIFQSSFIRHHEAPGSEADSALGESRWWLYAWECHS